MVDETGTVRLSHNLLPAGWVDCHGTLAGSIDDDGTGVTSDAPGFVDPGLQDFHLAEGSPALDVGGDLAAAALRPALPTVLTRSPWAHPPATGRRPPAGRGGGGPKDRPPSFAP